MKSVFQWVWAIFRYMVSWPISVATSIIAFPLAFIAALPVFVRTGPDGRESLTPFWQWITTHDESVDLYIHHPVGRSKHWFLRKYSQEQIEESQWLRYCCRLFWIWRNPAYEVAHALGFNQRGVVLKKHIDQSNTWDTGLPSTSWWTARNANGQRAFLWEKQWYFYKNRCLEMQFGWKLYRNDPDERCMIAFRFNPLRAYP